ncbi:hypothetical protein ACA910_016310 [Epithemia clementina (nom. ined.)]
MVLSFSEDPLESGLISSNARSESGAEPQSLGEESSVCSGSLGNETSANPLDEWSVEAVPRNPNFFDVPNDDPLTSRTQPTHVNPNIPIPSQTTPSSAFGCIYTPIGVSPKD